jgi:hypothetical protein
MTNTKFGVRALFWTSALVQSNRLSAQARGEQCALFPTHEQFDIPSDIDQKSALTPNF